MEMKFWTNQLISRLKMAATEEISRNNSMKNEIDLKNMRRLFYFSVIAIPVEIALVTLFLQGLESVDENDLKWRTWVIGCHCILLFVTGICCVVSIILLKKGSTNSVMKGVLYGAILVLLAAGIWLTAIDQLVTPNITPYILTCNIIALIFLIRPYCAAILYLVSFGGFYWAAGVFQLNQEILLSNRVNGLVAAGIGLCISVILWRANTSKILYKRLIETQKEELEQKNLELEEFAFQDQLTNLYNRRSFERIFLNEFALMKRYIYESCMIIVDLDHFKKINDIYGHPLGDMVLKEIASTFTENIRETDKAFRWGGEEFLILLPRMELHQGKKLAETLRRIIAEKIITFNNQEICVTASFGVVSLSAARDSSLETAYKDLDEALYLAKRKGRNRVEVGYASLVMETKNPDEFNQNIV